MIRILTTPDGEGLPYSREPYVGCTFPLADPAHVATVEADNLALKGLPPAHLVAFPEVLRGLETAGRHDWADHLRMLRPPQFVRFPLECAELVETNDGAPPTTQTTGA